MTGSAFDILFPYSADTDGIVVRVAVSYLDDQSEPARGRWFWAYHIRIENQGAHEVQLLTRKWLVTDGRGGRHRVEGEGVIGAQPLIAPGESYDYVSMCPLDTPTGSMEGSYQMIDEEGQRFDVRVPLFALVGPTVAM